MSTGCLEKMDVVFILDSSGSVEENFELAMNLTREIVQGLNFENDRARVGLLTYHHTSTMRFHLNKYSRKDSVLNAIAFNLDGGRTHTAEAIRDMYMDMFTNNNGDRAGVDNYAILVTDGRSNINQWATSPEADSAKKAGIKMFAVGVGHNGNVDLAEINAIASDPVQDFAHTVSNDEEMREVASEILEYLCD